MRVLTVRQPWAWAIVHGGKDVENRSRNIAGDYRGPVVIHAGLSFDYGWPQSPAMIRALRAGGLIVNDVMVVGNLLGVVDLVGVHRGTVTQGARAQQVASCFQAGKPFGLCSAWADHDVWHLELANPRPLVEPIPFRGALGLRTLSAEDEARILAEVR